MQDKAFFCSWSGGKDSCLALYHAIQGGGKPRCLLTMMSEDSERSRSHALPKTVLEAQAERLGVPIVFRSASWAQYEEVFVSALHEFRADGIEAGVFGDIDIEGHREWVNKVCARADVTPMQPLWKRERRVLLEEFLDLDFEATILVAQADKLGKAFLGRTINTETIKALERAGVDPSGEEGEYHTVVTGGPLFSSRLSLQPGEPVLHEGYWFLPVQSGS